MVSVRTMREARETIEAAGFTFDPLRSYRPEGGRPGWAFSVESLRGGAYGAARMAVRVEGVDR